ncbi:unnamed protein product [Symbiodinium microadriaticum]|nr:unnamed protein product [Symbiodinium microadriaticum]
MTRDWPNFDVRKEQNQPWTPLAKKLKLCTRPSTKDCKKTVTTDAGRCLSASAPRRSKKNKISIKSHPAEEESRAANRECAVIKKYVRPLSAPYILNKKHITKAVVVPETVPVPQLQMDTLNCPNYTSTEYWDKMGKDWRGEIMSSLDEDVKGVITDCLNKYCVRRPGSLAVDFGCGVGLYVPSLAARYDNVLGLDISRRLIGLARQECENKGLVNVRFKRADLGTCDIRKLGLECAADLAVCANVLISPEPDTRRSILRNAAASLRTGGYLLLVIPATRSAILCQQAHPVWLAERRRLKVRPARRTEECPEASCSADERKGIFRRDGVRTKHFRNQEVCKMLEAHSLELVMRSRVEYDWGTEFAAPVHVLEQTFEERPFDWIVIARKT